jgi:hypothetical protein
MLSFSQQQRRPLIVSIIGLVMIGTCLLSANGVNAATCTSLAGDWTFDCGTPQSSDDLIVTSDQVIIFNNLVYNSLTLQGRASITITFTDSTSTLSLGHGLTSTFASPSVHTIVGLSSLAPTTLQVSNAWNTFVYWGNDLLLSSALSGPGTVNVYSTAGTGLSTMAFAGSGISCQSTNINVYNSTRVLSVTGPTFDCSLTLWQFRTWTPAGITMAANARLIFDMDPDWPSPGGMMIAPCFCVVIVCCVSILIHCDCFCVVN